MTDLPREITAAILGRMMVKDIVRYRCVCKGWCSLIDDPDFIKMHLANHHCRLLLSCGRDFYWLNSVDFDPEEAVELQLQPHPQPLPLPQPLVDTVRVYILGNCNGLLAVANDKGDMGLWNPSTTRYMRLPIPFTNAAYNHCQMGPMMIGFGYDPINDDYKLLIVVIIKGTYLTHMKPHVRLFSLKAKTWKRINYFPAQFINYRKGFGCGVIVGNSLHWMAQYYMPLQNCDSIWAFDLVTEDFNHLSTPDCVEIKEKYSYVKLIELGGWLCLVCSFNNTNTGTDSDSDADTDMGADSSSDDEDLVVGVDIWVMKEYGVKESWTRLFSVIGQGFDYLLPIAYLKTSNQVLLNYGDKFLLYDMNEKRVENLMNVRINSHDQSFLTTTFCVESLIGFYSSYAQLNHWNEREQEKESMRNGDIDFGFDSLFIRDE